jgi:hypothetical protein
VAFNNPMFIPSFITVIDGIEELNRGSGTNTCMRDYHNITRKPTISLLFGTKVD